MAISLFADKGWRVIASTGRASEAGYLKTLGADEIIDRATLSAPGKPLGKEQWAAAVDSVGSTTLANVLAQTRYGGAVAACGLAGGMDLPTTRRAVHPARRLAHRDRQRPLPDAAPARGLAAPRARPRPRQARGDDPRPSPSPRCSTPERRILKGETRGRLVVTIASGAFPGPSSTTWAANSIRSGNIVDIIKNLQTFVTALRDSNTQIVQFNNRLATLTSVVNDSKSDLDAALTNLSTAVGEVQRFIAGTRDQTSEQIASLADVTSILVDKHMALENVLHAAPNSLANFYSDYNPDTGSIVGGFGLMNFANPTESGIILPIPVPGCGVTAAIENITATETGKLCSLFLGPGLRVLNFNDSPIPINPFLQPAPAPQDLVYSEPRLAPGGEGVKPTTPDIPPAVSAYTGVPGDPIPNGPAPSVPLGRIPGAAMPEAPPPTVPPPAPAPGLPGMLLPAEGGQP